jgi:hypothetical protein
MYLGVDPGLTGAVAALDDSGDFLWIEDMPTRLKGGRVDREVDSSALAQILRARGISGISRACVERISARPSDKGSLASFASLMHSAAVAEGVLAGLGASVSLADPLLWKRAMGLIGAGKKGSLAQARRLYPCAGLGLQKDHNRAEALLLARFCWLQRKTPAHTPVAVANESLSKEPKPAGEKPARKSADRSSQRLTGGSNMVLDEDLGALIL